MIMEALFSKLCIYHSCFYFREFKAIPGVVLPKPLCRFRPAKAKQRT